MADVVGDPSDNALNSSRFQDLVGEMNSTKSNRILLDNLSNWYVFNGELLLGMPLLKKYENIFRADLVDYQITKKQYYRPEYVSYELYGTTDFWYLILFLNHMSTPDEFNQPVISVFKTSMIETINKIYLQEANLLSTRENPRIVNKSIMKRLDAPSDKVMKDKNVETVDWTNSPNLTNNIDYLFDTPYNRYSYRVHKNVLLDKEGDLVKPFRLNLYGLFNVPSIYYKKGYYQTNTGRVQLQANKRYAFVQAYNGFMNLKLKDINSKEEQIILHEEEMQLWEPKLISDFRKANADDQTNLTTNQIIFDRESGEYVAYNKNNQDGSNSDKPRPDLKPVDANSAKRVEVEGHAYVRSKDRLQPVVSMKFTTEDMQQTPGAKDVDLTDKSTPSINPGAFDGYFPDSYEYNTINRRMDLSRIENDQFLSFNLEYSSKIDEYDLAAIEATSYKITLLYDDGSTASDVAYVDNMAKVYDTHGLKSFLKFTMINWKWNTHKIVGIQFDVLASPRDNNKKTVNFEFQVWSMQISSQIPDRFVHEFSVSKSGIYEIDAEYIYSYYGNQKVGSMSIDKPVVYAKPDLAGIYYNPQILQIDTEGTLVNVSPTYMVQTAAKNEINIHVNNPVIIDPSKNNFDSYTEIYSTGLKLPDDYILTVRLNYTSFPNTEVINRYRPLVSGGVDNYAADINAIYSQKLTPTVEEISLQEDKDIGGGVGFMFEYDHSAESGYMIYISSTKANTYLPAYNMVDGWNIAPSGFYQIDQTAGKFYPIWRDDDNVGMWLDNAFYFDPNGMTIKIIKKANRIRMFDQKSNGHFDYYHPFFHFTDSQHILMNSGLGFLSVFTGLRCEILNFYDYNDAELDKEN